MNKKIILTESQYKRLMDFINETPYDKVVRNVVKVGDIIRIEYRNSTSNFKVVDNTNGQIIMDNIDSGSANINYRYFISTTSLYGSDLQIRRVHKIKEKDKLNDIKSWKILDVKDIKNIEVIRGGSVIDTVDADDSKESDNSNDVSNDNTSNENVITKADDILLVLLQHIKEGNGFKLNLINNESVLLCCISRGGNKFSFGIEGESSLLELNNWDTFTIEVKGNGEQEDENLYELNKNIIQSPDGGKTFSIIFKGVSGEKTKDVVIKGIVSVDSTGTCYSEDEENVSDDNSPESITKKAKIAMDVILNDPIVKKAFYKKPTLWNYIVSAVKGENPKGTGILPAIEILNKYGETESRKKLGPDGVNFKANKLAQFEVLYSEVLINPTSNPKDILRLNPNTKYDAIVNSYKLGDDKTLVLTNKRLGMKIKVLSQYREIPDAFEVNIIKVIKNRATGEVNEYPKPAIIKFYSENGSGYVKTKIEPTK